MLKDVFEFKSHGLPLLPNTPEFSLWSFQTYLWLHEKSSKYGVFFWPVFSWIRTEYGKYGPEKTPYFLTWYIFKVFGQIFSRKRFYRFGNAI